MNKKIDLMLDLIGYGMLAGVAIAMRANSKQVVKPVRVVEVGNRFRISVGGFDTYVSDKSAMIFKLFEVANKYEQRSSSVSNVMWAGHDEDSHLTIKVRFLKKGIVAIDLSQKGDCPGEETRYDTWTMKKSEFLKKIHFLKGFILDAVVDVI